MPVKPVKWWWASYGETHELMQGKERRGVCVHRHAKKPSHVWVVTAPDFLPCPIALGTTEVDTALREAMTRVVGHLRGQQVVSQHAADALFSKAVTMGQALRQLGGPYRPVVVTEPTGKPRGAKLAPPVAKPPKTGRKPASRR